MLLERKKYNEKGKIGYVESIFESKNILKTIYFPNNQLLYIMFNRGRTYSFCNIDQNLYDEFEKSDSQGKFFIKNIKNNDKYVFRKEFVLLPSEIEEIELIVESYKPEKEEDE